MSVRARRHRAVATVVALAVVPLVASCGVGQDARTNQQLPSGNGQYASLGSIELANITLVRGPLGSKTLTLLGNLVNVGTTPDGLQSVTLDEPAAAGFITGGAIPVLPKEKDPVGIGFNGVTHVNFYDVEPAISNFVPMTFTFRDAGRISLRVLVVPPVGVYEGIAPEPLQNPATAPVPKA